MAHFAEIDSSNTVINVIVLDNEHEINGEEYLKNLFKSNNRFIQTSYNTYENKHRLGGTPLRKNYAGIGYTYDKQRDAFIPPRPFESWQSWIINEDTCIWEAPVPMPEPLPDGTVNKSRVWSEANTSWIIIDDPNPSDIPENHVVVFDVENARWIISKVN